MKEEEILNKIDEGLTDDELRKILADTNELDVNDKVGIMAANAFREATTKALENKAEEFNEGVALWRAIRYITKIQMPMRIIDFSAMLMPNMEKYFANILTPTAFSVIQRQANTLLENNKYETEEEKEHLEKIANGQMPYGYSLEMPNIKED